MRLPPCSQVMMKVSILPTTSPPQLGQVAKHLSRTFAPFVAEGGEIGVPLIEAPPPLHFQAVRFVANQVDGHTHRQVAAHGRIERHQDTLRCVCEGSVLRKYAVEDRLSVLGFTGLEEGRVGPCFDEVALGIGPEQSYRLTVDLPTDDERGIEADVVLFRTHGWRRRSRSGSGSAVRAGYPGPGGIAVAATPVPGPARRCDRRWCYCRRCPPAAARPGPPRRRCRGDPKTSAASESRRCASRSRPRSPCCRNGRR